MNTAGYSRRGDILAVAGLLIVCLGFWSDCLLGGKAPVAAVYQRQMAPWAATAGLQTETRQWDSLLWDSVAQFFPWRLMIHDAARTGQLPLWNPRQMCGMPLVGNGQSALFYPPNWLYMACEPRFGMGLSAALHFFLAAFFLFGFCRSIRLDVLPSVLGALAFAFGGFTVTWIELPTLVNCIVWLPLCWWGTEWIFGQRKGAGAVLLGTGLAMTLLAGHFQIAAYVWLFAGGYAVVRLAYHLLRRRGVSPALWLAAAVLLGGLGAAVQLLPTLELGSLSPRGGGSPSPQGFAFHQIRAVRVEDLGTLVDPDFLGNPSKDSYTGISYSEHCGYVGGVTLLLGLLGWFFSWRRRHYWLLAAIALFALWGAMAGPPAMLLYWYVPKLGLAGGFSRLLSVWTAAAAVLGAMGLQALLDGHQAQHRTRQGLVIAGVLIIYLAFELLPWAHHFNPRAQGTQVYPATQITSNLQRYIQHDRYFSVTLRGKWGLRRTPREAVLPPNSATVYGLRSADGYDSLAPASYRQFCGEVEGADPAPLANGNMLLLENATSWQRASVAWLVTAQGITSADSLKTGGWQLRHEAEGLQVYHRNLPPVMQRASLRSSGQNVRPLRFSTDDLNSVTVELPGNLHGEAQVRDTYYPGWRAYVDGRPQEIVPFDGAFRQVAVGPLSKRLTMIYYPASVAVGGFVSLLAVLLAALLLTVSWQSRRVSA